MRVMQNMTIRRKLVSIIMLTCIVSLLLAGAILVVSEWAALRRDMVQNTSTHAAMIAENCKAAVAFEDAKDAEETLRALKQESSIVFGCVYVKSGEPFAIYYRDDADSSLQPSEPEDDGFSFDGGLLTVFKCIILDEETIGTLCLRSDLQPMYATLKDKSVTVIGVVLLASLAAYLVSSRLQRIISGPILNLADVAKVVSEKKDYSIRAAKQSNDEVGLLIDAFNDMLEQTEARESELLQARDHLETRVQERTAELTDANRKLEDSIKRANLLAKEATQASEAKSQFLANMSHEIRTPMNGVIGFADILADEDLTEQEREYVEIIRNCGRELLVLIDDILDFSMIEANKLETEITSCSLGNLLNGIESLMRPKAVEKGLEFRVAESARLPSQICTDPVRLRQCLINLVSNAIKFTEEGHVYVNVSVQEEDGELYIHFEIEDTGIGIPSDKQDSIFEVFTQVDGSHSRKYGGSGLGLAISKRLAGILGGRLTVRSREGEGSIFSLVLPVGVDVRKQPFLDRHNLAEELRAEQAKSAGPTFCGQVLVAEDVLTNQVLMKSLLKRMGLEVTIAEDGDEAVQKVVTGSFDLVLMDVQMPKINGLEATRALRKMGIATPIVALTAHAMKGDDSRCIKAGCDDYLSKPIDRQKLLDVLTKYLPSKTEAVHDKSNATT